eukprot:TRINITY_DN1953_c0_g1_i3.p1 TRINITY_DN1953_c0_g1~~TRINITY_DN1953_c0_g1_i3.p1  ORF type:complete len:354 (+),score=167.66 TRINITY_DN1953_c0_g1_i3:879-1940(+)
MLDGFIKKFVLCEKCDNPETVLKVKKNMIGASCKACGHIFTLDMRHKLTTFITKNPPEKDIDAQGVSLTKKKDRVKEGKDKNGKKEGSDGDADDGDWGEDDDADWGEDVSEEAVRKRMEALSGGLGGLVIDNDLEKSEVDRINIFHKFVVIKKNAGPIHQGAAAKEVVAEADRLEVKNKAPIVLCELLFDDKMFKEKQLEKYSKLFLRFTHENQKAQKYLLGGLEKTVETQEAALLNKVPHIFKILFEEDVLEEEVILEWAKKVSKKYVSKDVAQKIHDKAAPFIKWLKEAEEESDESSEGEIEVDFDTRAHVSRIKETSAEPAKKDTTPELQEKSEEKSEEDDDDDVDIDNI